MVVVGDPNMVEDATFIYLNMKIRLAFLAEKYNKTGIDDVSLNLFIKTSD
jgi:hypothetical protein